MCLSHKLLFSTFCLFVIVINGSKLIVLSSKNSNSWTNRARQFFGGLVLIVLSTCVVFASSIYNQRIATSNTELITNVVVILFLSDLDEMADSGLMAMNPQWAGEGEEENESVDARLELVLQENSAIKMENSTMKQELEQVKCKVEGLCERMKHMESKTIPWDTRLFVSNDVGIC